MRKSSSSLFFYMCGSSPPNSQFSPNMGVLCYTTLPLLYTTRNNHILTPCSQQNLYNVGYDLAVLLAVLGLTTTDGDIVTERLSIGCDATSRTSVAPLLTGSQPGLAGHNKFEYVAKSSPVVIACLLGASVDTSRMFL